MCDPVGVQKRIVAVFADIHANYHAFKACFEDALKHGADSFIFLGDYVSDLADPQKTMDLVYEIQSKYRTVCLRGNRERYMLDCEKGSSSFCRGSKTGSLLYTFENLRQRDLGFFKTLKIYDKIEINGISFEIAHGSRDDDRSYFVGDDPQIHIIFEQMESPYFLTAHSHRQYMQCSGGKTIVNPGSVGVPHGGNRWPSYALLCVEGRSVSVELRHVRYDIAATIHAQFANGLVDCGKYWAISILYDIITGEECTMKLLEQVQQRGDVADEKVWAAAAENMGMKFTEQEIREFAELVHRLRSGRNETDMRIK